MGNLCQGRATEIVEINEYLKRWDSLQTKGNYENLFPKVEHGRLTFFLKKLYFL